MFVKTAATKRGYSIPVLPTSPYGVLHSRYNDGLYVRPRTLADLGGPVKLDSVARLRLERLFGEAVTSGLRSFSSNLDHLHCADLTNQRLSTAAIVFHVLSESQDK